MSDVVWVLVDAQDAIVASVRAESAEEAREIFRREGQQGARVRRGEFAPAVQPPGPRCEFCDVPIEVGRDYRRVCGWERITREAGGTNAIRVPDRSEQRFACRWCIDKQAQGLSVGQQTLV